jgi:hypothetical protein
VTYVETVLEQSRAFAFAARPLCTFQSFTPGPTNAVINSLCPTTTVERTMTAAVSSASPSALSFEPIERLSISGGTPSNSLVSNYSTNDTADADAPYDEPDYDRESYREPEAAPEPTLIDRLDTIRESSAKAVAALKEANAAATDDAAEGGIKPVSRCPFVVG